MFKMQALFVIFWAHWSENQRFPKFGKILVWISDHKKFGFILKALDLELGIYKNIFDIFDIYWDIEYFLLWILKLIKVFALSWNKF